MEPHVSEIVRVIQLVVAPVFLLTAIGTLLNGGAGADRAAHPAGLFGALVSAELTRTITALFVLAMAALVASLLLFLREIFLGVSTPRHRSR